MNILKFIMNVSFMVELARKSFIFSHLLLKQAFLCYKNNFVSSNHIIKPCKQ